jgi:hypothetical protein
MHPATLQLFNDPSLQNIVAGDTAATSEHVKNLKEDINSQDGEHLFIHVIFFLSFLNYVQELQMEEWKEARQKLQSVLQDFTSNVSVLVELNNDINGLVEIFSAKC